MGCLWSSHQQSRAALYQVGDDGPPADAAEDTTADKVEISAKLNAQDYILSGLKSDTRTRLPGSINGQQFVIDNCQDCSIFLLDQTAAVTVDDCVNCRIFTGPVASSIFFRDCKDCTFITTCQQFRTRDCHNCKIMLFCRTKPIIESSSRLQFGCLDLSYKGYTEQLNGFSKWQNFWSDVYDFTDAPDNWTFLPEAACGLDLLAPIPMEVAELFSAAAQDIPKTAGRRPVNSACNQDFLFVLFAKDAHAAANQLLLKASDEAVILRRTNEAKMDMQMAAKLAQQAGWEQEAAETQAEACVGLEFDGQDCNSLRMLAGQASAFMSASVQAAEQFRFLGLS